MDLRGKRVTVVGLGIEGAALVPYLVQAGAHVTVSDSKPAEALTANLSLIQRMPVRLSLGANRPEDCVDADIIFVSQGVPLDIPALTSARGRGVPFSSVTRLFMDLCPAPILGITGSAGKSTTTALMGAMFRAANWPVMVGGNIGVMLLGQLDELTPQHWVVLEISHTQLELTDRSPNVAVVTNISPSHADRYTMEEYVALKERLFAFQSKDDTLVINWDDPVTRSMAEKAHGHVAAFAAHSVPPSDGAFLRDDRVMLAHAGQMYEVIPVNEIRLLGAHNIENVLAATAAAVAAGLPIETIADAVRRFKGIEHRLEWVGSIEGADYYNDSIATTPVRAMAGMRSFDRPIVLLAGGKDKDLPLEAWAVEAARRCSAIVLFGAAAQLLEDAFKREWEDDGRLVRVDTVEQAVLIARKLARRGDVVLLSPGCTSFDHYSNFEARGKEFKRLVQSLQTQAPSTQAGETSW